jgi:hypothetical protein
MKEWLRPKTSSPNSSEGHNSRSLNKFLLAITLIVAFSVPALAALEKARSGPDQRHVESVSERQSKVGNAQLRLLLLLRPRQPRVEVRACSRQRIDRHPLF